MDLGSIIKELRKEKKHTQKEFANICELSQTYLSQIENNQKDPNISTLKVIAQKLEIPLPVIFFMALSKDDIPEKKRDAFGVIHSSYVAGLKNMLSDD